jgi:formylglycine-generating enzyme required for sulfatase activity
MPESTVAGKGGYRLASIPKGNFMMGSSPDETGRSSNEGPVHEVHISPFCLGLYPVTNREYILFLNENRNVPVPYYFDDVAYNQPEQPVTGVSFEHAEQYCHWAGLRLPTEAEWEYACRAGTSTRFYAGDDESDLDSVAWYSHVALRQLHVVGQKAPNRFGLYDMHGNVWEWCKDAWHDSYTGAPSNGEAWLQSESEEFRVLRGGSWFGNHSDYLRSATRYCAPPDTGDFNIGFRCAL